MSLIDADALYDTLADKLLWLMNYGDETYLSVGNDIRNTIDAQPTAYDVDKVVEQLEDRSTLSRPVGWSKSYEIVTLADAIGIVKGGGMNE